MSCKRCGKPKPKGRGRKLCDACSAEWRRSITRRRCGRCGGPTPQPQKHLCDECLELEQWKRRARRREAKRQPCIRCGGPKGPGYCRRLCDRCRAERATPKPCVLCGVRPRRYKKAQLCEICKATQPARARAYRRRVYHDREKGRAGRYKSRVETAEQRQRHVENSRITKRITAERNGHAPRLLDEATYVERYGTGLSKRGSVPAQPLQIHLTNYIDGVNGVCEREVAHLAGVSEKVIARIVRREAERISLVTADRLCAALDLPFGLVYGDAA